MKDIVTAAALAALGMRNGGSGWLGPKGPTPNKYTPHQGKQEIARRKRRSVAK